MDELTAQEIAEDYRRQLQDAAGRRLGLENFEGRNPLEWFDEHELALVEQSRETGATEVEINEILAGMRAEIAAAPVGARLDDPFGRMILQRLFRRLRTFCESRSFPIHGDVAYGLTPVVGLLASQRLVMGTDASVIELSVPLMRFVSETSRLMAETVHHSLLADGRWEVSFDPKATLSILSSRPDLLTAWTELLCDHAVLGWPTEYRMSTMSTVGALQTRVQLTQASQLFAVAHELGHHVLRHGDISSSEGPSDPFLDEYEADLFAVEASADIASSEAPLNFYSFSGVGGVVLLVSSELVARTASVLDRRCAATPITASHPATSLRIRNMAKAKAWTVPETARSCLQARACFATILELVWRIALPRIEALHDVGVRSYHHNQESSLVS